MERNTLRESMRQSLDLAHNLRVQHAPRNLITDADWAAHSAKMRLWGWTGAVPLVTLDRGL